MFPKDSPKCCQSNFYLKRDVFQNSPKVTILLKQKFHPDLLKNAQSGHTAIKLLVESFSGFFVLFSSKKLMEIEQLGNGFLNARENIFV